MLIYSSELITDEHAFNVHRINYSVPKKGRYSSVAETNEIATASEIQYDLCCSQQNSANSINVCRVAKPFQLEQEDIAHYINSITLL